MHPLLEVKTDIASLSIHAHASVPHHALYLPHNSSRPNSARPLGEDANMDKGTRLNESCGNEMPATTQKCDILLGHGDIRQRSHPFLYRSCLALKGKSLVRIPFMLAKY